MARSRRPRHRRSVPPRGRRLVLRPRRVLPRTTCSRPSDRCGKRPEVATEIARALITKGAPVFARGGALVEPICETTTAADGRKTITARLRPLSIEFVAVANCRRRDLPGLQP